MMIVLTWLERPARDGHKQVGRLAVIIPGGTPRATGTMLASALKTGCTWMRNQRTERSTASIRRRERSQKGGGLRCAKNGEEGEAAVPARGQRLDTGRTTLVCNAGRGYGHPPPRRVFQ